VNAMEILYWSPEDASEELIYEAMKKTYLMIHTYKDKEFYGKEYQDVQEVLSMQEQDNQKDIFDGLD
jgi:hypothetical protein